MNEEDLMFKEAFEYLKPYWKPKIGDNYVHIDEELLEPEQNCITFDIMVVYYYLNEGTCFWKARVEDFEKILTNSTPGGLLFEFLEWFYLHYENEKKLPDNFSITLIWLCYFMEILNKRQWNREIKKWEALP